MKKCGLLNLIAVIFLLFGGCNPAVTQSTVVDFSSPVSITETTGTTALPGSSEEYFEYNQSDWFYPEELEREPYQNLSYLDENISGMMTIGQLWEGKEDSILNDAFDEEIVQEWDNGGVHYKRMYITSRIVEDGPIRVYAVFGVPLNAKNVPAVLHIHGGGQTLSQDWVKYWTSLGYAAMTFDYCGEWEGRAEYTKYPESVRYGNQKYATNDVCSPDAASNSWHEWTYMARRMLTYMASQPQVNEDKMGIFGISMGGTMTWMVAGVDDRVAAAAPIYGAGYDYSFRRIHPYDLNVPDLKLFLNATAKKYVTAVSSEAYAPYIKCPLLYLSASNDFHGSFDWASYIYDALPADTIRRISISPNYDHHIFFDQKEMLPLFMGAHLKQNNIFPKNPHMVIAKGDSGKPQLQLRLDTSKEIEYVKLYYGLETVNEFRRFWDEAEVVDQGNGFYTADIDVLHLDKGLFAYASVKYKDGYYLSTTVSHAIPQDLGCTVAAAETSRIIYTAEDNTIGWGTVSIATDPLPQHLFMPIKADENGITVAKSSVLMRTYRLYDPRYQAPSDKAKLKITFSGSVGGNVTVSIMDVENEDKTAYSYSKQVNPKEDGEIVVSLQDLVNASGKTRSKWSQSPLLQFSGMNTGLYVSQIEWIE